MTELRRRRSRWVLVLCCVVASFALRAPGVVHHAFDGDEAYVTAQALVLRHGGDLYTDAVDRKPPLLPYLAAGLGLAGVDPLVGMRILAALAEAIAALCLAVEAGRRFGPRCRLPVAIGFELAVASFAPATAEAANGEIFVVAGVAAAVALAARRRWWLAGVAVLAALMVRQTAALFVPVVALTGWVAAGRPGAGWLADHRRRLWSLVRMAIPTLVAFPVVAAVLGWRDFWFWVGGGASTHYVGLPHDWGYALARGRTEAIAFLVALLGAWVLLAFGVNRWRRQVDLWLWVVCGVASVVIGFRFLPHYALQALPPLVVLAGGGWEVLTRRAARAVPVVLAAIPVALWLPAAWATAVSGQPLPDVAAWVRTHTATTDRIFVWGSLPELYGETQRLPATRFITSGFLTGHNAGRPGGDPGDEPVDGAWAMFRDDVAAQPPAVVIDTSAANVNGYANYPMLVEEHLAPLLTHYRVATVLDGVPIYVRREPAR